MPLDIGLLVNPNVVDKYLEITEIKVLNDPKTDCNDYDDGVEVKKYEKFNYN